MDHLQRGRRLDGISEVISREIREDRTADFELAPNQAIPASEDLCSAASDCRLEEDVCVGLRFQLQISGFVSINKVIAFL